MTHKEWTKLNYYQRRIIVAGVCGYNVHNATDHENLGIPLRGCKIDVDALVPDYLNDLNAMREAAEALRKRDDSKWFDFEANLREICGSVMNCIQATAAQRAEAFVLTMTEGE